MPGKRASEEERREQILASAFDVAARERLDGLTVRRVAAEAGLSPGLVFFHFKTKDALLVALLDRVISSTLQATVTEDVLALDSARDRLLAHVRAEAKKVVEHSERIELFFDYWVMGTRHPQVRRRIVAALADYRQSFRPLVDEVIAEEPIRFAGIEPDVLAAMVVSFLEGNAVQAVMQPGAFDVDDFMTALKALVPPPGGAAVAAASPASAPERGQSPR